jgi:hypothetical protein
MALRWTQPPTEMSTRNLPGGKGRRAHEADNLTVNWQECLENVGTLTFAITWATTASYRDKKNSMVLARKRTIPIERSPPVSEASAKFSG